MKNFLSQLLLTIKFKKMSKDAVQKTATIIRGGETFVFENEEGLSVEEFGVKCEEAIDRQLKARDASKKYNALGNALLKQITDGTKASDFEVRKLEVANFEKENPKLSKGFIAQIKALEEPAKV